MGNSNGSSSGSERFRSEITGVGPPPNLGYYHPRSGVVSSGDKGLWVLKEMGQSGRLKVKRFNDPFKKLFLIP